MSEPRPRLLLVTTSFPLHANHWSGVFVHRQAAALTQLGCDVTVLAPAAPGAADRESFGAVAVRRFRYLPDRAQQLAYGGGIPANLRDRPWLWLTVPFFAGALALHVRRFAAAHDMIHAHWSFAGAIAGTAWVRHGKPLVVSFHGSDLAQTSGPYRRLAARACRLADAIVVHSDAMRERALAVGAPPEKILLLPHGVDLDEFAPARGGNDPAEIVAVGRLSAEKGFDVLLSALAGLPAEPRWRLTLVGEGPLADALRQQAAALAFADRVRFAGALPPPHVREALSRADLAVCPSRREGFSVTTLEAMAAALPVVGTRVGALPTLINDEATGVLVPPEDAAALRAAIARLLADADLRRRMGAAAREVVAARYNVVAVNRPLAALVHRLAPRA